MKLVKLEIFDVELPFRFSFKHALADRSSVRTLILRLSTDSGVEGYGQVLPREYLTGETIESAVSDICERWWPELKKIKFESPVCKTVMPALVKLRPLYEQADSERRTASYAGIDVAVIDAYAREFSVPGGSLFGQEGAAEVLTAPLGGAGEKKTRHLARIFKCLGFLQYKLKVGLKNDLERVAGARAIIGDKRDLRVDANAAWGVEEAIGNIVRLKEYGISSVEQPVAAGNAEFLLRVQRETGLPVMADESLCNLTDAKTLLGENPTDRVLLWNVRLGKVGGFSGAMEMIRMADANGVGVHLGVLVGETSLLASAQRSLFGLTEYTHTEYGFPRILLKGDPFRGGPAGFFGKGSSLSGSPGLGVVLNKKTLRRFMLNSQVLD